MVEKIKDKLDAAKTSFLGRRQLYQYHTFNDRLIRSQAIDY